MIFADPEVESLFATLTANKVTHGDYETGAKAFAFAMPRNHYIFPDNFNAPKTHPELDQYYEQVRIFEQGYDEAAKDSRYKQLHDLAKIFQRTEVIRA